jgi:probable F420-dependent oxidoreductase
MEANMRMRLGLGLPAGGVWGTARNIFAVAGLAEELGYSAVWTLHRLLYPTNPIDPWPPKPDAPMPAAYRNAVDPLVALAAVGAGTSRIRLGVAAIVAPYYSALLLAKQVATLDMLSGGRLDLGIVPGWSRDEFNGAGVPHAERGERTDEILAALPTLLRPGLVSYESRRFTVREAIVGPAIVQAPSVPILIGGYSEATIRRIVRFGDGYVAGQLPFDQWRSWIKTVSDRVVKAGRDPAQLRFVCRCQVDLHDKPLAHRGPFQGDPTQIRSDFAWYEEFGVTDLFIDLNFDEYIADHAPDAGAAYKRADVIARALAPNSNPPPQHERGIAGAVRQQPPGSSDPSTKRGQPSGGLSS